MGKLTFTKEEIELMREMFAEKAELLGIPCRVYEVKDYPVSNYRISLSEVSRFHSVECNLLFEDDPKPSLLKGLGWVTDEDDESYEQRVAYLPWNVGGHTFIPSVGSIIEVPDLFSGDSRFFEVTALNASTYYMVNYIVKLAPYREPVKAEGVPEDPKERDDNSYVYINK